MDLKEKKQYNQKNNRYYLLYITFFNIFLKSIFYLI